ncbi:glycosyltransferase family 1 protein [Agathobacter sp. LCP21S3_B2]|uniref:glycosyltransferase family 1 protein n=1 Tax=Agathobacter sp. LCP21S3_B2 TaxID=3438734 RepID=UPI003F932BF1
MIRVLQCVNDMHRAGLETMLMNYYRNLDRTKIQFDFLTHRPCKSDYDDEIVKLGGKVYYAPRLYPQNYIKYFKWMKIFFENHQEYKIIHSHIDAMSYLPLKAAKIAGVPIRIAHSHSTSIDRDFKYPLKQIYRNRLQNVLTDEFACGKNAGEFLFKNDNFIIIPNAIEADKFYYNDSIRLDVRKELEIPRETFVVGHVGRISYPKNHKFLIDIFKEFHGLNHNSVLLIVGTGELEEEIINYANKSGVRDSIIFLGNRDDTDRLYQAFDVFVLPSLFEGVPLVGIEAQFAGLPCFFSDMVPSEVAFSNKTYFINLHSSPQKWASEILKINISDRKKERISFLNSNYDIHKAYKILENQYSELYERAQLG